MNITDTLKAQLKTLETERKNHEKAAATIKRNEDKVRKAIALLAVPAPPATQAAA